MYFDKTRFSEYCYGWFWMYVWWLSHHAILPALDPLQVCSSSRDILQSRIDRTTDWWRWKSATVGGVCLKWSIAPALLFIYWLVYALRAIIVTGIWLLLTALAMPCFFLGSLYLGRQLDS